MTEALTVQEEEIDWVVDDPDGLTVFTEELACLTTTLPSGIKIGWDTCGCGRSVLTCGCESITLPLYVVKMRQRETSRDDLLDLRESAEESADVASTTETPSEPLPQPQTAKRKTIKRPRKS